MIRLLRPRAGEFRQVLNELTDAAVDDFLRRITEEGTADGDAFPLVELTAVHFFEPALLLQANGQDIKSVAYWRAWRKGVDW